MENNLKDLRARIDAVDDFILRKVAQELVAGGHLLKGIGRKRNRLTVDRDAFYLVEGECLGDGDHSFTFR